MLADDFFRLAHDDTTGRPRLHLQGIGLGLASALLGELLVGGRIGLDRGTVVVQNRQPPPDVVTHAVLDHIRGEPSPLSVRTWLAFVAQDAYWQVAGRLARAGHVRQVVSGMVWNRTITWLPVDVLTSSRPTVRLSYALGRGHSIDQHHAFLAGLAVAVGLDEYLIRDAEDRDYARDYLRLLVDSAWEPGRELVAQTQAAVGNALVTHRA